MRVAAAAATLLLALAAYAGPIMGRGAGMHPAPLPTYATTRTVVTTTTAQNGWVANYPWERKVFRANGLYWLFYGANNGSNLQQYRTSADGVTWSSATTVRNTTASGNGLGHRIGYWHDGTYVHYGACDAGDGDDIVYRRGTTNSDGTITWSAAEQTILNVDASHACGYATVTVDSTGHPWVSVMYASAPSWTAPYKSRTYKASTTDGTWTTDAGFPQDFISNSTVFPPPVCVPLTAGKVYCTYPKDTNDLTYGMLWDGAAWGGQESIGANVPDTLRVLIGDGDVVHFAYETNPAAEVEYLRRSPAGVWSSVIKLTSSAMSACCTHLAGTLMDNDYLRVFWNTSTNLVRYRDVRHGVAVDSGDATLQDESIPTLANILQPNALLLGTDPLIAYTTKNASPFDVVVVKQVKK